MAIKIGILVLLVLGGLVLFIATRPAHFRLERSKLMHAPSAAIFPLLEDLQQWSRWSPWEKLDPHMKKTFSGAAAGVGARYAWAGNKKAGEGSMTIVDSRPSESISLTLEFLKPFPARNQTRFELSPAPGGTQVRWIMEGENGFMAKAFNLVVNMDALVGKDFEEGLSNLSKLAEASAPG